MEMEGRVWRDNYGIAGGVWVESWRVGVGGG